MIHQRTPAVVLWYRVYAALMTFVYFITFSACLLGIVFGKHWMHGADMPPWLISGYLVFMAFMSLGLAGIFVASFFLKPSPGAWTYHIILICLGMTSACFLIFCVPLLIFWLQDPVKAYFGKIPPSF